MNRFLIFAGESYYPAGGMDDFKGAFSTENDARTALLALKADWSHYLDTETGKVVAYWRDEGFTEDSTDEHYEKANTRRASVRLNIEGKP